MAPARVTRTSTSKTGMPGKMNNENLTRPPLPGRMKNTSILKETTNKIFGLKRKSETVIDANPTKKRSAVLGDITNAANKNLSFGKENHCLKPIKPVALKPVPKPIVKPIARKVTTKVVKLTKPTTKLQKYSGPPSIALKEAIVPLKHLQQVKKVEGDKKTKVETSKTEDKKNSSFLLKELSRNTERIRLDSTPDIAEQLARHDNIDPSSIVECNLDNSIAYVTASEVSPLLESAKKSAIPEGVIDFDAKCKDEVYAIAEYAHGIFEYYKGREANFVIDRDYISNQPDVSRTMRSILVDWMVEVQESFELNHETLYLGVKLVDLYLSREIIQRDSLQLIGSTALFISCKFDERSPPYIDDFLYICDDAYQKQELILMEIKMLKTLQFDLGVPLSYRYLRRYSRCAGISMEDMTFARFILESSLLDYDLVASSDYKLGAAALFLALTIKGQKWVKTLEYYSGCTVDDLKPLVSHLHEMLLKPHKDHIKTIRSKYSHKVFYQVAKIAVPATLSIQ